MSLGDSAYYSVRAGTERALAREARDPRVAAVHRKLVEEYEKLAEDDRAPELRMATNP